MGDSEQFYSNVKEYLHNLIVGADFASDLTRMLI